MDTERTVLVIDKDMNLLRGAEFALRGVAQIRVASTFDEATIALRDAGSYSVILTDLTLPKMDGGLMQRWLRDLHPDAVRIVMVGKESTTCVCDAINEAGAFRVLAKPFNADALRRAVSDALAKHSRTAEERDMLEGTLHGSLEAIAGMIAVVQPAAFGRAVRVRRIATLMAEKIGLVDKWEIQIAALMSQFGTVWLPAELVERLCRNQSITSSERSQVLASIDAGLKLFQPIPRMSRVCEILRSIDLIPSNDADPSKSEKGDAERVLTLALDFDCLFAEHGSAGDALRVMESRIGHYHAPYFDTLREIVGTRNGAILIDVPLADVRVGQFFAADVRSPNDLLLVARGQPVTPPLLFRIRNDWSSFASRMMVRMVDPPEQAEGAAASEATETTKAA